MPFFLWAEVFGITERWWGRSIYEVIEMKVKDHLSKQQHEKMKSKYKNHKPERIDWHDLMGMNRDTYKRGRGGAIRRR
ncbi:hypothetical protein [Oceanobacillus limi]|nr:hypothetical protein [Oceanobacillus limi]